MGRAWAVAIAAVAVLAAYVVANLLAGPVEFTPSRWPIALVNLFAYPSTWLGILLDGLAVMFVLWVVGDRSARSWAPAAAVLVLLGPAIMAVQDVVANAVLPGASASVALDAFSGLAYSLVTVAVGLMVALIIARLLGVPSEPALPPDAS